MIDCGGLAELRADGGPEMISPHVLAEVPQIRPGNLMNNALEQDPIYSDWTGLICSFRKYYEILDCTCPPASPFNLIILKIKC